ncbi:uncharacterized protein MELLADRAFT_105284 [Melampsora larici-populina 98AG31]|uniref:Uncharacterized protein n=1 Tax=Melampsora larici-populina (strain 98AG31 / pathotype 3-4-7) TaxID=747676 RepID=F4RHL4_MELLP|nr:uncharacterized protein MELLADRAFT_105284 [Melampsora larici-populina 98AG31]EGG08117.1 hypothetical protein MELLADRAFT_105284 [Melampsora larici-populina 98AG31]
MVGCKFVSDTGELTTQGTFVFGGFLRGGVDCLLLGTTLTVGDGREGGGVTAGGGVDGFDGSGGNSDVDKSERGERKGNGLVTGKRETGVEGALSNIEGVIGLLAGL